ncbi:hypothetical protein EJ05DRAFT_377470 [Pseudovirgaria hyperparasitica]|uniref:Metallo-beta-lactamase domain-containing protein n=1 Tax=Pseudovirgaria hyperparasitica TaxID=470096 RepID=A0A6A6W7W4_9PEZI|nr:uncharacterized protein EJ05DRAFT_377470 [Pseudovirgaria hyperparasitica]KAF2758114.1 hypothetical protein EJ05DRAFT_377470 [Pseudovirgaria hyperparasitica]
MAVSVKSLNGDSSFLLTFSPPVAPVASSDSYPGSFTVLVDPWLTESTQVFHPKFALVHHKTKPCIESLTQLPHEPDLIIVSQDKPDHCNRDTLCQLPRDLSSTIVATPAAAKKIKSWQYFDPNCIIAMDKYDERDAASVCRLEVPAFSRTGHPGEVTIAWMPAKWDLTGSHHAFGITYRPPYSVLSAPALYVNLPPTPPASPASLRTISTTSCTLSPSPTNNREKTLSVIYSPHGVPYDVIKPYASSHLVEEAALPLNLLIHAFDRVENPWFLGGNIAHGCPGGVNIARNLLCKTWVGAHDADKDKSGISVKTVRIHKYNQDDARKLLSITDGDVRSKPPPLPELITLGPGAEHRIVNR